MSSSNSNSSKSSSSANSNVLDFNQFREKKNVEKSISKDRTPLFVSHLDGKIKGSPHFKRPSSEDFGDRLQRIRTSLQKINSLMEELKKQNNNKKD